MGVGIKKILILVFIVEHHYSAGRALAQQEQVCCSGAAPSHRLCHPSASMLFARKGRMATMDQLFCCLLCA